MRPTKLEIEGFASFRDRESIDFEGVDLFALIGPTGAGKSSILDAIVFSLYGSVPRYDDRRAVSPVITQGKNEAKLRLDFTIGAEAYTAVRVVRRQGSGATTREARLQKGDEVLAINADELSQKVAELLGLTFDQFTRCVLLPQGDFARFLHDSSRERNELLRRLFGFDLYRKLFDLAGREAGVADNKLNHLSGQLEGLSGATEANLGAYRARVTGLKGLKEILDQKCPQLLQLQHEADMHRESAARLTGAAKTLETLSIPDHVAELALRVSLRRTENEQADARLVKARKNLAEAERTLYQLPKQHVVDSQLETHRQHHALRNETIEGEKAIVTTREAENLARQASRVADTELAMTEEGVRALQMAHTAYHIAASLQSGESCPVCGGHFTSFPGAPPADQESVETARRLAGETAEAARGVVALRERERQRKEDALDSTRKQLEECEEKIADTPPPIELLALQVTIDKATQDEMTARKAQNDALDAQVQTRLDLKSAQDDEADANAKLDKAVNIVAHQSPPLLDRRDIAAAWTQLVLWADEQAIARRAEAELAATNAEESELRRDVLQLELDALAKGHGIEAEEIGVRDACLGALANAEKAVQECRAQIEEAKSLRDDEKKLRIRKNALMTLKQHLQTNRFETWFLNRSFQQLAAAASSKLRELSSDQYSITVTDQNEFLIIDHVNADERRSVRTLSGGETFLASLSLALALAEQVAAGNATKLESLFLDEGFGTLDPETLDIVSSAVQELGSQGRMIGVVTHVREFAEQISVRYEVRKGARGSTVERVDA